MLPRLLMKKLILLSFILLSGCGYRCHDGINCHAVYHKHELNHTPKIMTDNNFTVRGAVYVEELY